nr:MAG TPA: hypothetical protein [Caudoviricetes sp.]
MVMIIHLSYSKCPCQKHYNISKRTCQYLL